MLETCEKNATLVEALDKVLEKGAVVNGEVAISVADVDLIFIGLRLILTSISKAEELSGKSYSFRDRPMTNDDRAYLEKLEREIAQIERSIPSTIQLDTPQKAQEGIAKLVLTLVELIRRLLEKEAFRRIKRGSLSPVEIQKLGLSLKAVKRKVQQMQALFGIEDDDLNIDLGPLGKTL
jgi:hypothetical protein